MSEHKPTVGEEWLIATLRKPVVVAKAYKAGRVRLEGLPSQWRSTTPYQTQSGPVPALVACGNADGVAIPATDETRAEHAAEWARKDALAAAREAVKTEMNRLRARTVALDTWLSRFWHRKGVSTRQLLDEYAALMAELVKGGHR